MYKLQSGLPVDVFAGKLFGLIELNFDEAGVWLVHQPAVAIELIEQHSRPEADRTSARGDNRF